ncbi:hypothetical protein BTVI_01334 [Pitangus sulphuratus]|nr:hypothetical protein BTVI_127822 [Pitangus sulphuratus]KAJ7428071.1 hypothetical protein BTVI_01334 [Pitangus sulphuratus]
MAVDITLLFKASVKTVKTRNKALGVAAAAGDSPRDELLKRGAARSKSDFTGRAREVVSEAPGGEAQPLLLLGLALATDMSIWKLAGVCSGSFRQLLTEATP